ncbi:hypothetical protein ACLKA7_009925 [Drosophila subpalustris]
MVWNVVLTRSTHLPFFIYTRPLTGKITRSEEKNEEEKVTGWCCCCRDCSDLKEHKQRAVSVRQRRRRRRIGQHCNDCGHTIVKTKT